MVFRNCQSQCPSQHCEPTSGKVETTSFYSTRATARRALHPTKQSSRRPPRKKRYHPMLSLLHEDKINVPFEVLGDCFVVFLGWDVRFFWLARPILSHISYFVCVASCKERMDIIRICLFEI